MYLSLQGRFFPELHGGVGSSKHQFCCGLNATTQVRNSTKDKRFPKRDESAQRVEGGKCTSDQDSKELAGVRVVTMVVLVTAATAEMVRWVEIRHLKCEGPCRGPGYAPNACG